MVKIKEKAKLNDYKGVAGGGKMTMPRVCKSGKWGFISQQRQALFLLNIPDHPRAQCNMVPHGYRRFLPRGQEPND
jgi:hypothetical protein